MLFLAALSEKSDLIESSEFKLIESPDISRVYACHH